MPLFGPEFFDILVPAGVADRNRKFVERVKLPRAIREEQHLQERLVHPDGDALIRFIDRSRPDRVHIVFKYVRLRGGIFVPDHEDSGADVDDGPQRAVQFAIGTGGVADCEIEGCSCLEQCKLGGGSAPFVEINGKIYDGVTQERFCKLLAEAVKE